VAATAFHYVSIALRLLTLAGCTYFLARTAMRPDELEELRWYDRVIRAAGAILILALSAFAIVSWLPWRG
jgi:hypothetical protein